MTVREAVPCNAARTALGTRNGSPKDVAAPLPGATVIRQTLKRDITVYDAVPFDGLNDAFSDKHSGWHNEDLVTKNGISRADQDAWALRSQQNFSAAHAAGCTSGKGNVSKQASRKPAVTVIEKKTNRAPRISYKPALQKQIGESAFMAKRGQGIEPAEIPGSEQMELVDLAWKAPEADALAIDKIFRFDRDRLSEALGSVPCAACHEPTARACLRVVGDKHVCIPCSGCER